MTDIPAWPSASGWSGGGAGNPGELGESEGLAPVLVAFGDCLPQRRLSVAFRIILSIPHYFILYVLSVAAEFVAIVGWFAALFTGRLPDFAADFLGGYLRWQTRAGAYTLLLTDAYPPFTLDDVAYPVRLTLRPGPLNRLAVLFRLILAVPAAFVATLLTWGTYTIALFVTWLIVVVTGEMPSSLHQALAAVLRFLTRYGGYVLMLTSAYPSGLFGDQETPGQPVAQAGGPAGFLAGPGGFAGPVEGFADEPGEPGGPGLAGAPGGPGLAGAPGGSAVPGYALPQSLDVPDLPATFHDPDGWRAQEAPDTLAAPESPVVTAGFPGRPATPPSPLSPWRLVLSGGAKRLVAVFLAIGAASLLGLAVLMAFVAGQAVRSASSQATAADQAQAAFAPLDLAMNSFTTDTARCRAAGRPLACFTRADQDLAVRFDTFAAQVRTIPMPSAGATAAATRLGDTASRAGLIFHRLAAARTAARYRAVLGTVDIDTAMNRFAQDYQTLQGALNQP